MNGDNRCKSRKVKIATRIEKNEWKPPAPSAPKFVWISGPASLRAEPNYLRVSTFSEITHGAVETLSDTETELEPLPWCKLTPVTLKFWTPMLSNELPFDYVRKHRSCFVGCISQIEVNIAHLYFSIWRSLSHFQLFIQLILRTGVREKVATTKKL